MQLRPSHLFTVGLSAAALFQTGCATSVPSPAQASDSNPPIVVAATAPPAPGGSGAPKTGERGGSASDSFATLPEASINEQIVFPQASINGQPVRAILDTGSVAASLTPQTARRLGLWVTPSPNTVATAPFDGLTAPAELALGGAASPRKSPRSNWGTPISAWLSDGRW